MSKRAWYYILRAALVLTSIYLIFSGIENLNAPNYFISYVKFLVAGAMILFLIFSPDPSLKGTKKD